MSTIIPYEVVYSSSYDDGYIAKDLENQVCDSSSKGWQSARFCVYPQEIVLMLNKTARIKKVQILSHHCNIASKIEIFVGSPSNFDRNSIENMLSACKFNRLGYVIMSSNKDSDFKARELKSVHVTAECLLVKFIIHEHYVNQLNIYNQVSIIGINIIGEIIEDESLNTKYKKKDFMQSEHIQNTTDFLITQGFNKVDTDVIHRHQVTHSPDFLKNSSSVILPSLNLIEKKDESLQSSKYPLQSTELPNIYKNNFIVSKSESSLEKKLNLNNFIHDVEIDADSCLPNLNEKEERESSTIIDVFGMNMAQKLFSKSWKHRLELVTKLRAEIASTDHSISVDEACAISSILFKILQDQVFVVFNEGLNLLKDFLLNIPHKSLGRGETSVVAEKLLSIILKRTGDSNSRLRVAISDAVIEISLFPVLKIIGTLPDIIVKLVKKKKNLSWRLLKSQLKIMEALIKSLGLNTSGGFSTEQVMSILTVSLEHPNNEVREASLSCFFEAYHYVKDIRSYLPPDNPSSRKNPLYNKIFDMLEKADESLEMKQTRFQAKHIQSKDFQLETIDTANKNKSNVILPSNCMNVKVLTKEAISQCSGAVKALSIGLEDEYISKMCVFCGNSENDLDIHYWKSCFMLKPCDICCQVVEICGMNKHLVEACEDKKNYQTCGKCHLSVKCTDFRQHLEQCKDLLKSDQVVCPLCFCVVIDNEQNWIEHLKNLCPPNIFRLKVAK
ncbi:centrosomal protein of 104 kDa isoform X1 [Hydra vulgaris]|uniref:centrosomal protein of 104 kDa isoform X1 n=2 Tax=Hydra vulgaris TaxID=6087 RepID=UPI001F5F2421|nr:centrosomal protein of 104 kDa isoform X2 [Hydra vulgaris]